MSVATTGVERMSLRLGAVNMPIAITLALALAAAPALAQAPSSEEPSSEEPQFESLDDLSWLVGTWGDESALEHWTDGDGGLMLGVHRDLRDGRASFFEFLRIALTQDGGIVYLASPAGRHPPTVFPATVVEERRAVFANPDYDFPQRIEYRLENEVLVVTISTTDGGRQTSWRWSRRDARP